MLAPFVLPEGLIVALVVFPVCVHVAEEIGCAGCYKDGGDIRVGTCGVAIGVVGAVAVVGPEAVDCPGVAGTGGWIVVPELGLEELTAL